MSRSWIRPFVCAFIVLVFAGSSARGQMAYRKVMRSGEAAPDTTGFFDTQQLSAPSIDEAGRVSFSYYLVHGVGGVDAFNQWTLYSENALGELHLVARQGDTTPGNINYRFGANSFTTQHKNPLGQVAFMGTGTGILSAIGGIWAQNTAGGVVQVAVNGTPVSDPPGTEFSGVSAPAMNSSADIVFQGTLLYGVGGVTAFNDLGLWCRMAGGPLRLVAREGDALPNPPPGFPPGSLVYGQSGFSFSNTPLINAGGQVAFLVHISSIGGPALMAESNTLVPPRVVAYTGQLAPGLGNVTFLSFSGMSFNNDGYMAFSAKLTGIGVTTENEESLWVEDGGGLRLIAREGDPAPGGGNYGILYPPAFSGRGEIAFGSFLDQGQGGAGIYKYTTPGGIVQLIAREGMNVPGMPGVTFGRPTFSPSINNAGQVAFYASLTGAPPFQPSGDSVWATSPTGVLTPIVVKGQTIEISPGIARTITTCGSYSVQGSAAQTGQTYQFNNNGQLCVTVGLSDGTNAIYVASFPGCINPGVDTDGDGTDDCFDDCPNDATKIVPGICGCNVADTDTDGDGTADCNDGCPNDATKIAPGQCGCGFADTDTDADGTANCNDGCPNDAAKTAPGACGCGLPDTDSDADGTANCIDGCPADPFKVAAGICGCGVADTDSDADGTVNCNDACPADALKIAPGMCGCGVVDSAADTDGDGTLDCLDGCPNDAAKTAPGVCGCGNPDTDTDADGRADCVDNCPTVANPAQADADGDGIGDACDAMPAPPPGPGPGAPPPGPIVNPVSGCGAAGGGCGAGMMMMMPLMILAARPTRRRRTPLAGRPRCRGAQQCMRAGSVVAVLFLTVYKSAEAQCFGIWTQKAMAVSPDQRRYLAMAYDSARGVTVLFGGNNAVNLGDTWEWDGTAWSKRTPINSPPARCCHAMAYDSTRRVTVLFGGYAANELGDTWEWDGTNWTHRMPATSPSPREAPSMAYDSERGVTVLFGGYSSGLSDQTWEWDGTNWTLRTPATKPPGRYYQALAYDSARRVAVLFGGSSAGSIGDTWEWDGTNWTNKMPATAPSARYSHAMCYDTARGATVLFSGSATLTNNETWEWDGGNWTKLMPVSAPAARSDHAIVYDMSRRAVVLFGGSAGGTPTWEWEGPRPAMVNQPQARTVGPGQRAEFTVSATALATLSFRWRRNGVMLADAGAISGSGTETLVINPTGASDAGMYDCLVGNACGAIMSRVAALTLDPCMTGDASLDCDMNGIMDSCQIASNASLDTNGNGSLDSCEGLSPDCGACGTGMPMMMPLVMAASWSIRQRGRRGRHARI